MCAGTLLLLCWLLLLGCWVPKVMRRGLPVLICSWDLWNFGTATSVTSGTPPPLHVFALFCPLAWSSIPRTWSWMPQTISNDLICFLDALGGIACNLGGWLRGSHFKVPQNATFFHWISYKCQKEGLLCNINKYRQLKHVIAQARHG